MHSIEPFFNWRHLYNAAEDEKSPFYGREYSEFEFTNQLYNYLIHPQWDEFGSLTLYMKIIFVDVESKFCVIELLGEWNDTLNNDIMIIKRDIVEELQLLGNLMELMSSMAFHLIVRPNVSTNLFWLFSFQLIHVVGS